MRVIVVGGGVIGCSAAFALASRGAEVILIGAVSWGLLAPLSESDAPGDFVDLSLSGCSGAVSRSGP